jgi:hypothetical protein
MPEWSFSNTWISTRHVTASCAENPRQHFSPKFGVTLNSKITNEKQRIKTNKNQKTNQNTWKQDTEQDVMRMLVCCRN